MLTRTLLTRTLDDELHALIRGEDDACPACGEHVDRRPDRVECLACGSLLEEGVRPPETQLELA
jgi:hypothetical protein